MPEPAAVAPPDPAGLDADPEWGEVAPVDVTRLARSFLSPGPDGGRLRIRYWKRLSDGALVGRAWFGPGSQGPPGHAHGGSMASVLDDAMSTAAWQAGHAVLAARIGVEFRRVLPLGTTATLCAWVDRADGRKVHVRGRLYRPDGEDYAVSDGLFVAVGLDRYRELREAHPDWPPPGTVEDG